MYQTDTLYFESRTMVICSLKVIDRYVYISSNAAKNLIENLCELKVVLTYSTVLCRLSLISPDVGFSVSFKLRTSWEMKYSTCHELHTSTTASPLSLAEMGTLTSTDAAPSRHIPSETRGTHSVQKRERKGIPAWGIIMF